MKTYTILILAFCWAMFFHTTFVKAQLETCDTAAYHLIVKNDYTPACYQLVAETGSDSGAVLHADAADLQTHFWIWGCLKFGANPIGQNSLGLCFGYDQSMDSLPGSLDHPTGKMMTIEFDTRSQDDQVVAWSWNGTSRQILASASALPNGATLADDQFHYVELGWYPPDQSFPANYNSSRFKLWIDGELTLNFRCMLIDTIFSGKTTPRWWVAGQTWAPFGNQVISCLFEGECGTITLPIVFASVEAIPQPDAVKIQWNVVEDLGIGQYVVERSFDGINYSTVASLPSTNNDRYIYLDQNLQQGIRYYRILANGHHGKSVYSEVVETVVAGAFALQVKAMPNPVTAGYFTIQSDRAGIFTLRTIQGVVVRSGNFDIGETLAHVEDFETGLYFLELQTAQSQDVQRLILTSR